jgi:hypothetical protein
MHPYPYPNRSGQHAVSSGVPIILSARSIRWTFCPSWPETINAVARAGQHQRNHEFPDLRNVAGNLQAAVYTGTGLPTASCEAVSVPIRPSRMLKKPFPGLFGAQGAKRGFTLRHFSNLTVFEKWRYLPIPPAGC